MKLLNIASAERLTTERKGWVDEALSSGAPIRDERWSGRIAVGGRGFVEEAKAALDIDSKTPRILEDETTCFLREDVEAYRPFFEA